MLIWITTKSGEGPMLISAFYAQSMQSSLQSRPARPRHMADYDPYSEAHGRRLFAGLRVIVIQASFNTSKNRPMGTVPWLLASSDMGNNLSRVLFLRSSSTYMMCSAKITHTFCTVAGEGDEGELAEAKDEKCNAEPH